MPIELGGIELERIHRVATLEDAGLVHQRVPGLAGNVTQDLGRDSVRLQVEGIFYGEKAQDSLSELRKKYLKREPLDLLAEITGQLYASQVLIERLEVVQDAAFPDEYAYTMVLTEFVEPPPSSGMGGGLDGLAALEAGQLMDLMELPDMLSLGGLPELSNPFEPLKDSLTPVQEAASGMMDAVSGLSSLLKPE